MLSEDPIVIVRDILNGEWDTTNTSLQEDPAIHTGWYDYDTPYPQVTVTNSDEFAADAGQTGHTAGTGDGGVAQVRVGTILVNCWAGTRDGLEDAGIQVNPKALSFEMAKEVHRIIQDNASGTLDGGERQLNSLGADDVRRLVDTEREPVVFRHEVTVRYTYVTRT